MVNIPKLKGVHLAMHAGMNAAEAIYEKLSQGGDCTDLSNYQAKVEDSVIEKDLYQEDPRFAREVRKRSPRSRDIARAVRIASERSSALYGLTWIASLS